MQTSRTLHSFLVAAVAATLAGCTTTPAPIENIIVIADLGPPPAVAAIAGKYSVVVGKTEKLTATTRNATDPSYTWATSNAAVATVDGTGVVTGVATGEVEITATGANSKAVGTHGMFVIAAPIPATPVVNVTGDFVLLTYASTKLTATTTNGTDSGYTWTSSDTKIATVADDGTVSGVSPGTVTITATGKDTKATNALAMVVSNEIPHLAEWLSSGHADKTAEPFNDWNTPVPDAGAPTIPTTCARCHSQYGFRDYLGDDGSQAFVVDKPAPIGSVVDCQTCHNAAATALSQVTFPSGVTIKGLGSEARCMTCHQGRESTDSVNTTIKNAAAVDDDTVSAKLSFRNIHYFAAGATLNAGRVRGGYQFTGKTYDWRFRHVPEMDACPKCHNPHSLEINLTACAKCHAGVVTKDDLKKIRMVSSATNDYDGDGDVAEGIAGEIDGLRAKLLLAIQAYVTNKALDKICYSPTAYPYFFIDTNGNATCDGTETDAANKYVSWTNRMVRATYNYQVSIKDPGAFAHNAKYIIELIYDSIEHLNAGLPQNLQIDLSKCARTDTGHFNGAGEPARHWDANAAVDQSCSQCHAGSQGFRFYLQYGVGNLGTEPDSGMDCATCHDGFGLQPADFTTVNVASVTFPSKLVVKPDLVAGKDKLTAKSFICMTCHQGRESKLTVDAAINSGKPAFRNVHYLAAGAVLLGKEAQVGYEYNGQTYVGRWTHTGGLDCTGCHSPKNTKHTFQIADNLAACQVCHQGIKSAEEIRMVKLADYDGDADVMEPLHGELQGLADKLLGQMQTVVKGGGAAGICYNGAAYPYWFKDTNGNNVCDGMEAVAANAFAPWTAGLAKASYNYQFFVKDPGAWAHNFSYVGELLYDGVADLGGSTNGLTRP